jgi:hypothetical protein
MPPRHRLPIYSTHKNPLTTDGFTIPPLPKILYFANHKKQEDRIVTSQILGCFYVPMYVECGEVKHQSIIRNHFCLLFLSQQSIYCLRINNWNDSATLIS